MTDAKWFGLLALVGFAAFLMGLVHRRERNKLRVSLACKDALIEKLQADMMAVMDERNRYKGAFEAMVPPLGVVYETRIVRAPLTLEEQIEEMIEYWDPEDPR